MAYDKNKIYEQAEEAIKKNNLFFVEDIVAFLPCSKPTFYDFFPKNSNELNTLKDLLEDNKIKTKSSIRAKLWKSNRASELLALYRLIATPEEHQKLNQSYVEQTTRVVEPTKYIIVNDSDTTTSS
jgi:adenylate kinase family enzyme